MSISFTTDHERKSNGHHNYRITVETDIKRYFEAVQQVARDCIDDSTKNNKTDDNVVHPETITRTVIPKGSTLIDYVCSWCQCSLVSPSGYYIYCPRCGKRIDYSEHMFMKEGNNAIR